ncbi:MAG: hypothetical protein WC789_10705 [Lentisphaeria bacterium]
MEVRQPLQSIPEGLDAVYVYGELDLMLDHLARIHAATPDVPVVFNSTLDGRRTRRLWIAERLAEYRTIHPNTWAGAFTAWGRDFIGRELAVVTPKIIRRPTVTDGSRNIMGICVGEAAKLGTPRFVHPQAHEAIRELVTAGHDVWAYDHYSIDAAASVKEQFPGLRIVSAPGDRLHEWLQQFKVFLSFAANETFAMVPMEAMGCGVPLLYAPLPQSLDEYVGGAGIRWTTVPELLAGVSLLSGEKAWLAYSEAGMRRAAEFAPEKQGYPLLWALTGATRTA